MKISAKTEYACIAVMELACHKDMNAPVRIRSIAEKHHVPPRFLVQILLQLKEAGIVTSVRGASGGYQLLQRADQISIGDVMNIIDTPATAKRNGVHRRDSSTIDVLTSVWETAEQKRQEHLRSITFADLLKMVGDFGNGAVSQVFQGKSQP